MFHSKFCVTMLRSKIFLFCFLINFCAAFGSLPSDPTYNAAVVEYSKIRMPLNPGLEAWENLFSYVDLIRNVLDVDIIVFPESTLNNYETGEFFEVFDSPCDDPNFGIIVHTIACAARDTKMYVSINLVETSICPDKQQIEFNDTRPCPSDKINKYNTNVIFDRNGMIVSKYRKFNLYGEKEVIHPLYPEAVTFVTDFGVKFGHIICFDILFYEPTMKLILEEGVTDIIFPSMWFSKAPFLTAAQVQQAFAYANNINLLAAGASNPMVGSTGTGIYHGRHGPLVQVMNYQSNTKIYKATVPKMISNQTITPNIQDPDRASPQEMLNLFLKKDNTEPFNSYALTNEGHVEKKLCHGLFCCYFNLNFQFTKILLKKNYKYRLVAYDGLRTYQREAVQICAILACSGADINTCGLRYNNTKNVNYASVLFKNVTIQAHIQWRNVIVMPSSLDFSILPYNVNDIQLTEVKGTDGIHTKMELLTPKNDIYSFGLYVRNYDGDR